MTSIIAKRRSLHSQLKLHQQNQETLEKQTVQLESLANLGSATAMIAHELNNLLTPLANYAELALMHPEDRALAERSLRKTTHNCRHAGKVMEGILSLANAASIQKADTPLLPLVRSVFDCLCRDFSKDGITVEILIDADLCVRVIPVQLQQAVMNLILNARDAMLPRGGNLTIEARDLQDTVQLRISDTGCGIAPAEIKKVFDPFFSGRQKNALSKSGYGLGLALCKKVVDHHNGSITVDSQPGFGTTFTILLPKK
ncbi:MAG: HAMP domain-containing histidine kinase [Sedimentisphaerales bacterium]|nr:HAMP domain-containing histidine kinase [Sedimentisphaerales bacterium]